MKVWEDMIRDLILLNRWSNIHPDDPYSLWNSSYYDVIEWSKASERYYKTKGGE